MRLAKIVRSLWLFECDELMLSMQKFARTVKPHGGFRYGSVALDELLYMLPDDDGAAPITAGSPKLSPKMFAAGPPPFVDLRLAQ